MSKALIIIVVIVVVLGGAFVLYKKQAAKLTQTQPAQTQQSTETKKETQPSEQKGMKETTTKIVTYTEDGFQPASITVKVGETVTWTNKDSDKLWVASNPHPSHTDYPGFDELKGIPTGETYSFTFTKEGTWGYHNHLDPSNKGTVVVTK